VTVFVAAANPNTGERAHAGVTRIGGGRMRWGFLELFVLSQTVLPALLYLPGTQSLRIPIRVSAFAISLVALAYWAFVVNKRRPSHPALIWIVVAMVYTALQVFHPTTNSLASGAAQAFLYLAVLAPVFWVPDMIKSREQVWRLLAILLVCNGINATVGILQVYDPDRWLPKEFTQVTAKNYDGPLGYVGPDGKIVIRPPGLSDNPGAVCGPAVAAAMLGLVFGTQPGLALWRRLASLGFAFAGVAAIYLTHVRSSLIVLVASAMIYIASLVFQRQRKRATAALALVVGGLAAALMFAVMLGGNEIARRFSSLLEDDAKTVYYRSGRGGMVEHAFRVLIYDYPLGAGLGRWGMTRTYFGDESNRESPMIWAEVQWPAWILDGGVLLLGLYTFALLFDVRHNFRISKSSGNDGTRSLGAAIFAANVGTLALLFSFVPFLAPIGLQYWFLSGALHGAASLTADRRRDP
jgi:hypothetical protein